MEFNKILMFCMIFLTGFLVANIISFIFVYGLEIPSLLNISSVNNNAPFDFIKEGQIEILKDKVIIHINDASISRYAPTGSMKPLLDSGANGIRIKPDSEKDIHIGDIISFRDNSQLIVHRVVDKGLDNEGVYFITKGDNNSVVDGKVRFKDIEYVTIAIIW